MWPWCWPAGTSCGSSILGRSARWWSSTRRAPRSRCRSWRGSDRTPSSTGSTAAALRARLRDRARPIKGVLLDQHAVAGLGNIYTDEVLHAARVRFDRPAGSLTARQVGVLHAAIGTVLAAAIAAGGSTLGDAQYVGLSGQPGTYQEQHRVYGREGQPCRRCRAQHGRPRPLRRPLDVLLPPLPVVARPCHPPGRPDRKHAPTAPETGAVSARLQNQLSAGSVAGPAHDLAQPEGAVLGQALHGVVVHVDDTEAGVVAVVPLQVVEG